MPERLGGKCIMIAVGLQAAGRAVGQLRCPGAQVVKCCCPNPAHSPSLTHCKWQRQQKFLGDFQTTFQSHQSACDRFSQTIRSFSFQTSIASAHCPRFLIPWFTCCREKFPPSSPSLIISSPNENNQYGGSCSRSTNLQARLGR